MNLGEVDGVFPFSLGRDRNEVKRNVKGMGKTCSRCVHMARMISRRQEGPYYLRCVLPLGLLFVADLTIFSLYAEMLVSFYWLTPLLFHNMSQLSSAHLHI